MEKKLIAEIGRQGFTKTNDNLTDFIQVNLGEYRERKYIDLRIFFKDTNGISLPTKKGVTIRAEILHDLIVALQKAEKEIVLDETYITEG